MAPVRRGRVARLTEGTGVNCTTSEDPCCVAPMFDLEQFVADCRTALAADRSHKPVREVIARAVSDPQAVLNRPRRA